MGFAVGVRSVLLGRERECAEHVVLCVRVGKPAQRRFGHTRGLGSGACFLRRNDRTDVFGVEPCAGGDLLCGLYDFCLFVRNGDAWVAERGIVQNGQRQLLQQLVYAALAEIAWSLRVGDALLVSPPLPRMWWSVLVVDALGVWVGAMLIFSALAVGWPGAKGIRTMRSVWLALLVLGTGAAVAAQEGLPWALTVWYALVGAAGIPFVAAYCWTALRRGRAVHRLIALALLLNVAVGVRDRVVFRVQVTLGGTP